LLAKAAGISGRRGETLSAVAKLTHVHLAERELTGRLSDSLCTHCPAACVLYLYDNRLADVAALSGEWSDRVG